MIARVSSPLLLVLLASAARAEPSERLSERVLPLGPTRAQQESSAAELSFPFVARADEHLEEAHLRLSLSQDESRLSGLTSLEVLVNGERVALLDRAALHAGPRVREVPVPHELLSDRNQATLRLRSADGVCLARPAAWRGLERLDVAVRASPVPLPSELSLLPLPFYDPATDTQARVPLVFAHAPGAEDARVGALVAAWFAVDAPIPLSFEASVGELPDSRAIVLVSSASDAAALGLAPPAGPSLRIVDHPVHPDSNLKLLVVEGRTPAELALAAEALASVRRPAGPEVSLAASHPAKVPPARPWVAPRWVAADGPVVFSQVPAEPRLVHDGTGPGTLAIQFRVAPDLWLWPRDFVPLDLGWSERLPPGTVQPRLDVEMNGFFLATLPRGRADGATSRISLRIPREHLRGFNQLLVHVHYPSPDPCAPPGEAAVGDGSAPRVAIAGDSRLHLEGFHHFASQPDLSLFAFDGFPFSRLADLREMVVILPDAPSPGELSLSLSVVGQLAQITGRIGTGIRFASASSAGRERLSDADLLMIGSVVDHALLRRLRDEMPAVLAPGASIVRWPGSLRAVLDLLGGPAPLLDARRAEKLVDGQNEVAAVESIESPFSPGRTAILITAPSPDGFPPWETFTGYAEGRTLAGDLLLVTSGKRWMFRIGPSWMRGEASRWMRLRWFLATHWIALLPLLLGGALVFAATGQRSLRVRMLARLRLGEAS